MIVRVENDREVLRYEVPKIENQQHVASGSVLLLVHDADITGTYVVLFRGIRDDLKENEYELMWKGNIEHCLERFCDEVASFECDYNAELAVPGK